MIPGVPYASGGGLEHEVVDIRTALFGSGGQPDCVAACTERDREADLIPLCPRAGRVEVLRGRSAAVRADLHDDSGIQAEREGFRGHGTK